MSPPLREIRRSLRSCLPRCPSSQTPSPAPPAGRWAAGWTHPWGEPSATWTSSLWKALGRGSQRLSYSHCRGALGAGYSRWVWSGQSPGSSWPTCVLLAQSHTGHEEDSRNTPRTTEPQPFQLRTPEILEREPRVKIGSMFNEFSLTLQP